MGFTNKIYYNWEFYKIHPGEAETAQEVWISLRIIWRWTVLETMSSIGDHTAAVVLFSKSVQASFSTDGKKWNQSLYETVY